MKTFVEFMQTLNEKLGDFGASATYKKPKEQCYGRMQYYTMLKKKVCAFKRKRE